MKAENTEHLANRALTEINIAETEARQIMAVCRHFSNRRLEDLNALELGAANRFTTEFYAKNFRRLTVVTDHLPDTNAGTGSSEGDLVSVSDNSLDVIICNHYLELVENQDWLMRELYRIMKYDGFCYLGVANRYSIVSRHHRLPILSWMPRLATEICLKIFRIKDRYYPDIPSLDKLKRITGNFWRHDYTWLIRENPAAFYSENRFNADKLASRLILSLFKYFYPHLSSWIWILTKRR
jgi:SAM-dependent methyltransferase